MISPARSTTVSWASIKAVSLVAMAPGKPASSRSGTGTAAAWTVQAPGGEDFPGAPGQFAAQAQGGVVEDLKGPGGMVRQIIGHERQDPVGGRPRP